MSKRTVVWSKDDLEVAVEDGQVFARAPGVELITSQLGVAPPDDFELITIHGDVVGIPIEWLEAIGRAIALARPALDFRNRCQQCGHLVASTRQREIYTKNYEGPCGDSFCYASCESTSCRPIHVTVCDACAKELSR